jgi:hypothetical protein
MVPNKDTHPSNTVPTENRYGTATVGTSVAFKEVPELFPSKDLL